MTWETGKETVEQLPCMVFSVVVTGGRRVASKTDGSRTRSGRDRLRGRTTVRSDAAVMVHQRLRPDAEHGWTIERVADATEGLDEGGRP